jgi:abortive infection bacteriophage resistance protein
VTALNEVRNGCAHHSRIWNKPLVNSPGVPPRGTIPELDHLRQTREGDDAPTKRIYSAIVVMVFLLKSYYPNSRWNFRLKEHILKSKLPNEIGLETAGFVLGWSDQNIWKP